MKLAKGNTIMKQPLRKEATATVEPRSHEEDIRARAYELYEARGRENGHDLEDWFRAEEEITGRKSAAA